MKVVYKGLGRLIPPITDFTTDFTTEFTTDFTKIRAADTRVHARRLSYPVPRAIWLCGGRPRRRRMRPLPPQAPAHATRLPEHAEPQVSVFVLLY